MPENRLASGFSAVVAYGKPCCRAILQRGFVRFTFVSVVWAVVIVKQPYFDFNCTWLYCFHLHAMLRTVTGIPINYTSNLRLGSTFVLALWILKLSCRPLYTIKLLKVANTDEITKVTAEIYGTKTFLPENQKPFTKKLKRDWPCKEQEIRKKERLTVISLLKKNVRAAEQTSCPMKTDAALIAVIPFTKIA